MPCVLRSLHSSNYYSHHRHHNSDAEKKSPGFVADSAHDVAALALMIVFFTLLGTAIVLAAVYFSKRALDRECQRESKIRLRSLKSSNQEEYGKTSISMGESSRTTSLRSSHGKFELPRLQAERVRLHGDEMRSTIRDRRGLPELACPKVREDSLPRLPPLAHRLEPRAVFPGARPYGMVQIGNDGRVHRPGSGFEHVRQ